jgi:hypothetical protein
MSLITYLAETAKPTRMLTKASHLLPTPEIPYLDKLILTTRREPFASWARGDSLDTGEMRREDEDGFDGRLVGSGGVRTLETVQKLFV